MYFRYIYVFYFICVKKNKIYNHIVSHGGKKSLTQFGSLKCSNYCLTFGNPKSYYHNLLQSYFFVCEETFMSKS